MTEPKKSFTDLETLIGVVVLTLASDDDTSFPEFRRMILEELEEMGRQDIIDRANDVLDKDDEDTDSVPPEGMT